VATKPLDMPFRWVLATLARSSRTRFVGQPPERPHRWRPYSVPGSDGNGMTDPAAWELIADCLEDPKQKIETIVLRKPKGATAYVMKIRVPYLPERIYAKFEFVVPASGRKICGRSFHLEDPR